VRHPFATATVVTLIAAAIELTMTNKVDWTATFNESMEKVRTWVEPMLPAQRGGGQSGSRKVPGLDPP
jgi:hypothetical protein